MDIYLTKDGTDKISNIVHKYYRIDKRFLEVLINNEIWFSDPFDFNDPYDCNLRVDSNNTFEEIHSYLKDISVKREKELIERGHSIDEQMILERANYWNSNPDKLKEFIRNNELKELENKGIACFSKSDSILLMWSHYANSHKGACLTFDISKDLAFFEYPFNVDYPKEYPHLNFIRTRGTHARYKHILAMKSTDWEYEKEVRIVKDKRDHREFRGNVKFKKESLVSVKFGYKAHADDIKTIKEILKNADYGHVRLYKADLKDGEFGIDFGEVR